MVSYLLVFYFLLISSGKTSQYDSDKSNQDCTICHSDLIKNDVIHPDLESSCDICHSPTGEEHPMKNVRGFELTEKLPLLCYNCHNEFQASSASYPVIHGPLKDLKSCLNCHKPHSSQNPKLLTDATNSLCLGCHNKSLMKDSVKISNINQRIANVKSIHPAIDGGCVTCHNPHYSQKKSLLIGDFPESQYIDGTKESFELCFMCHDSELLKAKTTETGTNFRNGKINLHYLHVNSERGRNCIMCHDIHGALNDRLISDKLKFGNWEMKISFELSENGGSCLTACHSEKKYDRTIPEENISVIQQKVKK